MSRSMWRQVGMAHCSRAKAVPLRHAFNKRPAFEVPRSIDRIILNEVICGFRIVNRRILARVTAGTLTSNPTGRSRT